MSDGSNNLISHILFDGYFMTYSCADLAARPADVLLNLGGRKYPVTISIPAKQPLMVYSIRVMIISC